MSTSLEFWEGRYRARTTPWDYDGVPPALSAYLARNPPPGVVLIPGCGFGYEVQAFHAAGWQPTAFDFSPTAVAQAKEKLGPLAAFVREADFFTADLGGPYDLVYERTFLCAIHPERQPVYVEKMRRLLRPGGVIAGFFFYGEEPDGPPNPLPDLKQARALFTGFDLIVDQPVPAAESQPLFAGRERWQEWQYPGK